MEFGCFSFQHRGIGVSIRSISVETTLTVKTSSLFGP